MAHAYPSCNNIISLKINDKILNLGSFCHTYNYPSVFLTFLTVPAALKKLHFVAKLRGDTSVVFYRHHLDVVLVKRYHAWHYIHDYILRYLNYCQNAIQKTMA